MESQAPPRKGDDDDAGVDKIGDLREVQYKAKGRRGQRRTVRFAVGIFVDAMAQTKATLAHVNKQIT